jgi:hypothetical protein
VHLGARGCHAEQLPNFLRYHDAEIIYLVGDIVDGWQLRSGWFWPQHHNDVVQKLLRKARKEMPSSPGVDLWWSGTVITCLRVARPARRAFYKLAR